MTNSTTGWASLFLLNARILLVDDDQDFAMAAADILRKGGIEVRTAQDANAALVALQEFEADVIVSDLAMPLMRGDQLLAELRKGGYRKPFILMTGFTEMTDIAEAMHLDVSDYLVKPIDSKILIAAVQSALRAEHQRLIHEEQLAQLYQALSPVPPPDGSGSWEEAIKGRAIANVRKRRLSR
ncbi:MAG: response regulator [Oligoflexia bacterium]|nr:response regulator [Oligoflexia bacterium]